MASSSDFGTLSQESEILNSEMDEYIMNALNGTYSSQNTGLTPNPEYGGIDNMQIDVENFTQFSEQKEIANTTGTLPSMDEYTGDFNFQIYADGSTSLKNSWVFSHTLKKVFLDYKKVLLIQFKTSGYSTDLKVRALMVFKEADFRGVAVDRCKVHSADDDKNGLAHREEGKCFCADYNWVGHVIQSSHPEACYEYDSQSKRHSVIVPLDPVQPGSETVTVPYSFTCKTSCISGMNRKPVNVIFTLENSNGIVIGRQILPVKICSCPKRDKNREENCGNVAEKDPGVNLAKENEKPVSRGKSKAGSSCSSTTGIKKFKTETFSAPVTPDTTYDMLPNQGHSPELGQESSRKFDKIKNGELEDDINSCSKFMEPLIDETAKSNSFFSEGKVHTPLKTGSNIKRNEDQEREDKPYDILQIAAKERTKKDNCMVFGQMIAGQLRKLSPRNQAIARNKIQNVIFELEMHEMGTVSSSCYDISISTSESISNSPSSIYNETCSLISVPSTSTINTTTAITSQENDNIRDVQEYIIFDMAMVPKSN